VKEEAKSPTSSKSPKTKSPATSKGKTASDGFAKKEVESSPPPAKKVEPKPEPTKKSKRKEPATQKIYDPKAEREKEAKIREEANKEADEAALERWTKDLQMMQMRAEAQLKLKADKIKETQSDLDRQALMTKKANEEIERLN